MIRIVTDSTASIPHDIAVSKGVDMVTLYLNRNGVEYEDATMDIDSFYQDIYSMIDDIPKSSQPSQLKMEKTFESIALAGDELVGIFMSSKMSGTVENALRAAKSVANRDANFKYRIIDSLSNCYDEAWAVLAAATSRDSGCTLDQCCDAAIKSASSSRWLFAPESLRFLKAGGRIGNASALLGNLMKLCPIFTVRDGLTTTFSKVRTQKKALVTMANKVESDIKSYGLKNIVVHYIGSSDEARRWAHEVIEPMAHMDVQVLPVSPVIGLHVGPAIGVVYECLEALPGKFTVNPASLVYAS